MGFVRNIAAFESATGVSSVTGPVSAATTGTGSLVLAISFGNTATTVTSVSDTQGNVYVRDAAANTTSSNGRCLEVWRCASYKPLTASDTISVVIGAAADHAICVIADQWSTVVPDASAIGFGYVTSSATSGSVSATIGSGDKYAYTAAAVNGPVSSITQPTGYTRCGSYLLASGTGISAASAEIASPAAGSDTDTWSWSTGHTAVLALIGYLDAPSGADTASGTDVLTHIHLSSADTGSGTDLTLSHQSSDSDNAAGADAGESVSSSIRVHDGDGTGGQYFLHDGDGTLNLTQVTSGDGTLGATPVAAPGDGASFTESQSAGPKASESGSAAESAGVRLASGDRLLGTALSFLVRLASVDSAAAAEGNIAGRQHLDSDNGSATESGSYRAGARDFDNGSAGESASTGVTLGSTETAAAKDNGERLKFTDADRDYGEGTEDSTLQVAAEDSAGAADAHTSIRLEDGDEVFAKYQVGALPQFPNDVEYAEGEETGTLGVTLTAEDSGQFGDRYRSHYNPELTAGVFESFSVAYGAILDGSTGYESARLSGVRSGSVTANVAAWDLPGDDISTGTWYEVSWAHLSLHMAMLGDEELRALGVPTVSAYTPTGQLEDWAAPLWPGGGTLNAGTHPMVLRSQARDAGGIPRVLDLVLYRCELYASFSGLSYKSGITVALTGYALFSQTDEAGAVLPSPQIGRAVISPAGAPTAATTRVFG